MITHLELTLTLPQGLAMRAGWGYALYGFLCRQMPPALGEYFHRQALTPLRQSLHPGAQPGRMRWEVDLFGEEAAALAPLLQGLGAVTLDGAPEPLAVEQCATRTVTAEDLLRQAQQDAGDATRFLLRSTTGFKTAGRYAPYPTAELTAKSLLLRLPGLLTAFAPADAALQQAVIEGLALRQYQLQSSLYPMKAQAIPGFTGSYTLQSNLRGEAAALWRLLCAFAPYSGLGIKTALGMGAVKIEPNPKENPSTLREASASKQG